MHVVRVHAVVHGNVGVGSAGGAAGRSGVHGDGKRRTGGIILRDGAAVVGGSGDGDVYRGGAVGEAHNGVGGTARRSGFGLHLDTRDDDGFVGSPSGAGPSGSQRAGEKNVLLGARIAI